MPPSAQEAYAERAVCAIRAALERVPFYARLGLAAPSPGASLPEALAALPLLTRDRLRATLPKAWLPSGRDVKGELASGKLAVVETGEGASRIRLLFDPAAARHEETRALGANAHAAAALGGTYGAYRDAVLWVPERGTGSCGAGDPAYEDRVEGGRLHLNSRQDPTFWTEPVMTRMLDELERHATTALLADPFYLDVLARHAQATGRALAVRGFVALARALPLAHHRAAIRRVFSGPVLDLYGNRAAGPLFVTGGDGRLHHVPSACHVELLPAKAEVPGAERVALVVVTTLEREVQPLLRFVLGDLVSVAADGAQASPGGVPPLASVEGRLDDALLLPSGALVTPGAIDRAMAPLGALAYQIVQRDPGAASLEVVGASPDEAARALAPLLEGLSVTARATTAIGVEPNGKYRSSKRVLSLDIASAFEGIR